MQIGDDAVASQLPKAREAWHDRNEEEEDVEDTGQTGAILIIVSRISQ